MERDAFLARVKSAAEIGRQYRVHIHDFPPETGYVGVSDDLCTRLAAEIIAVGGEAFVVPTMDDARLRLATILESTPVSSALCWQHELLDRLELRALLAARNIRLHDAESLADESFASRRQIQLACDVGITSVDCAVAETGSLLVGSRLGRERLASLLPPMHVAVVERSQIVPDLLDAFAMLQTRGVAHLPSNLAFITGPSKTGDIELQLTTGVHGPGRWWVIIVAA